MASLIVTPLVLFLDEPTTGLDPRSRADIWATIQALAAGGTTILLTTQYLEEADRLCDQIVIVDSGRVTTQGSPSALKDALGRRVDVTVADAADLAGAAAIVERFAQGPPSLEPSENRLTAAIAAGAVTLPELVRGLDAAGVAAQDVSIRRPTLDEVFLDHTGARDQAARDKEAVA